MKYTANRLCTFCGESFEYPLEDGWATLGYGYRCPDCTRLGKTEPSPMGAFKCQDYSVAGGKPPDPVSRARWALGDESHEWGPHKGGIRWVQCQSCEVLLHEPEAKVVCGKDPAPIKAARVERARQRLPAFARIARAEGGFVGPTPDRSVGLPQILPGPAYARLSISVDFSAFSSAAAHMAESLKRLAQMWAQILVRDLTVAAMRDVEPWSRHWWRLLGRLMRWEARDAWRQATGYYRVKR